MPLQGLSSIEAGKVVLKARDLSDTDILRLGHILQNHPRLKGLEICLCDGLSEAMIMQLAKCLVNSSLKLLQLVHVGLGNKSANIIAARVKDSVIRKLDLTFNRIGFEGATALAHAIKGSKLHSLLLGRNEIGSKGAISLAQALQASTHLKLLDLRMNGIEDNGVLALIDILPKSALESLQLDSNHISDEAACIALQALSNFDVRLKSLSLAKNQLSDSSFAGIGAFSSLQHLVLAANELGDGAAVALATNTISQSLHLEMLDLRNNPCMSDIGVLKIIEAARNHRSLKRVFLSGTGASQKVKDELEATIQALNSERAKIMTVLCSPLLVRRLGTRAAIAQIPGEILRLLADLL